MIEKVTDLNVVIQTLSDLKTFLFGGLFGETFLILVTLEREREDSNREERTLSNFNLNLLQLFEKFFDTFDLSDHFRVFGQGFFLVFVQFFSRLRLGFVTLEFLLEIDEEIDENEGKESSSTFRLPRFRCFFSRTRIA